MTTEMTTEAEKQPLVWRTSQQAADYFGVHLNYMRTIPASKLPYYTVGRNRRYTQADLDKYLASIKVSE